MWGGIFGVLLGSIVTPAIQLRKEPLAERKAGRVNSAAGRSRRFQNSGRVRRRSSDTID